MFFPEIYKTIKRGFARDEHSSLLILDKEKMFFSVDTWLLGLQFTARSSLCPTCINSKTKEQSYKTFLAVTLDFGGHEVSY
jgi:hypothetical protein